MIFLNKIKEDLSRLQKVTTEISLGSEKISSFEKDGVVLLKNLISDRWQDPLKEAIEENIKIQVLIIMLMKLKEEKVIFMEE